VQNTFIDVKEVLPEDRQAQSCTARLSARSKFFFSRTPSQGSEVEPCDNNVDHCGVMHRQNGAQELKARHQLLLEALSKVNECSTNQSENFQVVPQNTFIDVKEVLPKEQQTQTCTAGVSVPSKFFFTRTPSQYSEVEPCDVNNVDHCGVMHQQNGEQEPPHMQTSECPKPGTLDFLTSMARAAMKTVPPKLPDAEFIHTVQCLGPAIQNLPWPSLGACLHGLHDEHGNLLCKPCAWFPSLAVAHMERSASIVTVVQ